MSGLGWSWRQQQVLLGIAASLLCCVSGNSLTRGWEQRALRGGGPATQIGPQGEIPWRAPRWAVDINRARWPEIAQLPGISRVLGERIVARRQSAGWYHELAELQQVPGIGPVVLTRLAHQITVSHSPAQTGRP